MIRMVSRVVWDGLPNATKELRRSEGVAFVREIAQLSIYAEQLALESIEVPITAGISQFPAHHHREGLVELRDRVRHFRDYCIPGSRHGGTPLLRSS
ncbi:MAG: hypothetical protein ACYDHP_12470 [Ferrimicrobium sp.]